MKDTVVLFLCLCLASFTNAQTVFEEDFESFSSCPTGCVLGFIDEFSCLPQWAVSHGTPSLTDSDGNTFMAMYSTIYNGEQLGEGIFSNAITDLAPGNTYKICFDYTTWAFDDSFDGGVLKLFLAESTNMDHQDYNDIDCFTPLPNVQPHQEIIDQAIPDLALVWNTMEAEFTVDEDFSSPSLLVFMEPTDSTNGIVGIDNIMVQASCTHDIIFDSPMIINPDTYEAGNNIECGTNNTTGNIIPNPWGEVTFEAGGSIILQPNFYAGPIKKSQFMAHIVPCEEQPCGDHSGELRSMATPPPATGLGEEQQYSSSRKDKKRAEPNGDIKIIPNPNDGEFRVLIPNSFFNNKKITISVYNLMGKRVLYFDNVTDKVLNINGLSQGIYTVELRQENNPLNSTQRVVVGQ